MFSNLSPQKIMHKIVTLCCLLIFSFSIAHAETQLYTFNSPEQERLYYEITAELRCPQCQNNNIAESNAGLSTDMRAKVYELLQEGNTKKQIIEYMTARYGNFITYDPPMTASTIILWIAPIFALLIGATYIVYRSRRSLALRDKGIVENKESATVDTAKTSNKPVKVDRKQAAINSKYGQKFAIGSVTLCTLVVAVSFGFAVNWGDIKTKNAARKAVPQLMGKLSTQRISSEAEVYQLAVGLRSQLEKNPANPDDWILLGYLYNKFFNQPVDARHAYAQAYKYAPDNAEAQNQYGLLLMRTSTIKSDQQLADKLLTATVTRDPKNIEAVYWVAVYAQSQKNYIRSIGLWQNLLNILPASSPDVTFIQELLERDQKAYAEQRKAA